MGECDAQLVRLQQMGRVVMCTWIPFITEKSFEDEEAARAQRALEAVEQGTLQIADVDDRVVAVEREGKMFKVRLDAPHVQTFSQGMRVDVAQGGEGDIDGVYGVSASCQKEGVASRSGGDVEDTSPKELGVGDQKI